MAVGAGIHLNPRLAVGKKKTVVVDGLTGVKMGSVLTVADIVMVAVEDMVKKVVEGMVKAAVGDMVKVVVEDIVKVVVGDIVVVVGDIVKVVQQKEGQTGIETLVNQDMG